MAIVILDTCVVTDLADPNSVWFEWAASTLEGLDANHTFIINPIIYTECSVGYETIEETEGLIGSLGLEVRLLVIHQKSEGVLHPQ